MAKTGLCLCVVGLGCEMACFRPLGGWMARHPNPDSGRVPVTFSLREGYSDLRVELPCGRCVGCLKDKATAWAVRCYHESTLHRQSSFLTLTYDDAHMPDRVRVDDLQRFLKRLRRRVSPIRYFACGEYGGQTLRPHYHLLIFGHDFLEGSCPLGFDDQYTSPVIEESWPFGFSVVRSVNSDACFYVTGYTLKNMNQADSFHISSRRPYIGAGWLREHYDNISRLGHVVIDGKRHSVPLSYLRRPEFALEFEALVESRKEHVRSMSPDDVWNRRAALRGKEINLKSRTSNLRSKV